MFINWGFEGNYMTEKEDEIRINHEKNLERFLRMTREGMGSWVASSITFGGVGYCTVCGELLPSEDPIWVVEGVSELRLRVYLLDRGCYNLVRDGEFDRLVEKSKRTYGITPPKDLFGRAASESN